MKMIKNNTSFKYIIALTLVTLVCNVNSYSQVINSVGDLTKNNICEYSIERLQDFDSLFYYIKKSFCESAINNFSNDFNLFLINIASSECFDFRNEYGIFIVGEMSSHPFLKILIVNKDRSFELTESKEPMELLKKLNLYFVKNEIISIKEQISTTYGLLKYINQENGYPISQNCLNYSWQCDPITTKQ